MASTWRQAERSGALLIIVLLLAGCGPGDVLVRRLADPPVATHTAPEALRHYTRTSDLPSGFYFLTDPTGSGHIFLALPGWPTAKAPHRVLGLITLRGDRGKPAPLDADRLAEMRAAAARMGANALLTPSKRVAFGYALFLSEASPPAHPPTAKTLKRLVKRQRGQAPIGEPVTVALSDSAPTLMPLLPGHCHSLLLALAPEAQLSEPATRGLQVQVQATDPLIRPGPRLVKQRHGVKQGYPVIAPTAGPYAALHGAAIPLGCSADGGQVQVSLSATAGGPAGEGEAVAQMVARATSQRMLDRLKARRARRRAGGGPAPFSLAPEPPEPRPEAAAPRSDPDSADQKTPPPPPAAPPHDPR